ncbi:hypothetical protein KEM48_011940 [Puccinia striiformis f. sp. tritici PST-130]|nr:hypothetical protein KEM48_011940 [Puccinia striiformis f. sp. tritici PST-130]
MSTFQLDHQTANLVCKWSKPDCFKTFSSAEEMFNHLCDCHVGRKRSGNLSLSCSWEGCDHKAAKRDHMTSHMMVHCPLQTNVCGICDKTFKRLMIYGSTNSLSSIHNLRTHSPHISPARASHLPPLRAVHHLPITIRRPILRPRGTGLKYSHSWPIHEGKRAYSITSDDFSGSDGLSGVSVGDSHHELSRTSSLPCQALYPATIPPFNSYENLGFRHSMSAGVPEEPLHLTDIQIRNFLQQPFDQPYSEPSGEFQSTDNFYQPQNYGCADNLDALLSLADLGAGSDFGWLSGRTGLPALGADQPRRGSTEIQLFLWIKCMKMLMGSRSKQGMKLALAGLDHQWRQQSSSSYRNSTRKQLYSHRSTKSYDGQFFGQPLPITHPHLLGPDELTIGIPRIEYAQRRAKLMQSLPDGSAVIIAGARTKWMAHHVFYPFRQSSDFWYLTGFQEPDSCLLLEKENSTKAGYTMTMFVRPKDPSQEMWEGARSGVDGVTEWFGADQTFDISELARRLKPILTKSTKAPVYLDLPSDIELPPIPPRRSTVPLIDFFSKNDSQTGNLVDFLSSPFTESFLPHSRSDLDSCLTVLSTTRSVNRYGQSNENSKYRPIRSLQAKLDPIKMIKSDSELKLLRIAGDISAHGFKAAMRLAAESDPEKPGSEHELVQVFEAACHQASPGVGARMGYVPVCAAGQAALTIHYTFNDRALKPNNQLVLFDAGFEYAGYVADITRTFPVGNHGKFNSAQKDLYELVKNVEKELILQCRQNSGHSLSSLHRTSCQLLKNGLESLGFNLNHPDALNRLYPHYIGHPVGTDLHDTPSWNRSHRLQAGSVITIEPGIYVPDEDHYPKHFRGIGIRVEDMVHIREDDQVILSCNTPKEVLDVQACASGLLDT